jgi:hypothetical protein
MANRKTKMNEIVYLGKARQDKTITGLAKKLSLTTAQVFDLMTIPNITKYLYNKKKMTLLKINLKTTPQKSLRDFKLTKSNEKKLFDETNDINRNLTTYTNVPEDINIMIKSVLVWFSFAISSHTEHRKKYLVVENREAKLDDNAGNIPFATTSQNLYENVEEQLENYIFEIAGATDLKIKKIEVITSQTEQKLLLTDSKLRKCSLKIYNQFVNVEENEDDGNCVRNYLMKQLYKNGKGISKKAINNLGDELGITTNELAQFAEHYQVSKLEAADYLELMDKISIDRIISMYGYSDGDKKRMLKGIK